MSFIKGNPPAPHKFGCSCFRCSGNVWNKGLKGIHLNPTCEWKKGQHVSPETEIKKNQRLSPNTEFKKGMVSWCVSHAEEMPHGENHRNWKGDEVGYISLHTWVARELGKAKKCEHCGTTTAKKYNWSNISGEYKRDLTDWQRLCVSCHIAYDKEFIPGKAIQKFPQLRKNHDSKIFSTP